MTSPLLDASDGWELPVTGWQVTRCFVDWAAFGLLVGGGTGDTLRLYLEGAFTLTEAGGREAYGGNDSGPTDFAPLLRLMGRAVQRVHIARTGDLRVELDAGAALHVPPDPDYEAWELDGLGKLMVICMPGGGEPAIFNG
jgi:hypothetical protein